jgi:tetratricopeptide (TPR) repeat protein
MDKIELVKKAKDLISDGYTDEALDLVEAFLAERQEYRVLHTESVQLSSVQNQTKLAQTKQTISFENAELRFAQVRDGLLNLLDYIERDELMPKAIQAKKPGQVQPFYSNKWLLIIGLPLLLLAAAVLILVKKIGGKDVTAPDTSLCQVVFRDTLKSKNFLIIPFFKPTVQELQPEGLVIDRLSEFCNGIESLKNSEFDVCDKFVPTRTLSFDEAAEQGKLNKATIVIWGNIDKNGNTTAVKTRYKYLGNKDIDGKVPFQQLGQEAGIRDQGEQTVITDNVLSVIASSGELTQDLETTLKLMVGMIAQLEGDRQGALTAMETTVLDNDTSKSANLLKYMVLADNYIAMNEPQKAKAALDTCLSVNDSYWLGRNNRANLMIKSGEYLAAIEDLNVALAKRPEDTDMLLARGVAFKKSEQLYAAKKDFEMVVKMKPEKEPELRKTIDETDTEIKRLEKIVEPTKVKLTRSQITQQDLVAAAEASNKLGNNVVTKQFIAKGLELDQNNPKLIAVQIDNLLKEQNEAKAAEVLAAALKRKVKKAEIARQNKNVASFISRLSAAEER